jgi:ADP-ribose pyrophosphatase YjhB (NUDIX family)
MTVGAFVIILEKETDKFLLCHRQDKDAWNLPGGRVEDGESPWQAALREVKEEIGLSRIVLEKLVGVHFKPDKNDLVFTFLAFKNEELPLITDEADNIVYFSVDDMPQNTAVLQRERIVEFFKNRINSNFLSVFSNQ